MDKTNMIYLDQHTSVLPCSSAIDRLQTFLSKKWYSSNSPYCKNIYDLENAYQTIYDFTGAKYEDSFVFTSSASEAINQVLFGVYHDVIKKTGKTHVITSKNEQAAILLTLKKLEEQGVVVHYLEPNQDGVIALEELEKTINPRVSLITLSWADALTGTIQPVESIAQICQKHGILFHVDASSILGKVYLPLNDIDIHYMTFCGNLLHGPVSSGGLFMKKGHELSPLIIGENEQGGLRAGPLDVGSFLALSAACQQSLLYMDHMSLDVARLRSSLEKRLQQEVGAKIFFQNNPRLPNVSCVAFEKVNSEALLYRLHNEGVVASFGGDRWQHLSNVIKGDLANSAVSFVLSRYTTKEEIDQAADIIIKNVKFLQTLSFDL
ncbi:MAG: aminotransferase class V-fold PLP-dependent enzyme [Chlamydiota bacterium]|jgi:cysteine desulfurase